MADIFEILKGRPEEPDYCAKPVIVQGITGKFGSLHTRLMKEYGTNIAGGVTPGKDGQEFEGIPIYGGVGDAVQATGARISAVFVPARFFLDAVRDALEAGIKLLVAIPEHVPVRDSLAALELARRHDAIIIGPNTPGVIIPGVIKVGIMPAGPFKPGDIAVISKSGTLLYEISNSLSQAGFGQMITLGVGGDPINGTRLLDAFEIVKDRPGLRGIVVVGEIGGDAEEMLAQEIIDTGFEKPVVAYVVGRAAPKEKRMGHAGAIVYGEYGSAESKMSMFLKAGVPVARKPLDVPVLLAEKINSHQKERRRQENAPHSAPAETSRAD